jgi:hypothetical protein
MKTAPRQAARFERPMEAWEVRAQRGGTGLMARSNDARSVLAYPAPTR